MAATADALHARVLAAADDEGRLPASEMTGWEIFPFEPGGLRVVALEAPVLPEAPRSGVGGVDCRGCAPKDVLWSDGFFTLVALGPTGAPLVLMMRPVEHHDLPELPDELAARLGVLLVHVARAVEALPNIARCHVSRWGDGGEHLHVFFYARPAGFSQLRGTCFAVWDDLLPTVPLEERDADAAAVVRALVASAGGS